MLRLRLPLALAAALALALVQLTGGVPSVAGAGGTRPTGPSQQPRSCEQPPAPGDMLHLPVPGSGAPGRGVVEDVARLGDDAWVVRGSLLGASPGTFLRVHGDGRDGGFVRTRDQRAWVLRPAPEEGMVAVPDYVTAPQDCAPASTRDGIDGLVRAAFIGERAPPARLVTVDILFLIPPRALLRAGGLDQAQHCVATALATANRVFGAPEIGVSFVCRGVVPIPGGGAQLSPRAAWDDLRDPNGSAFGRMAHRLRDRFHADLVCLVTDAPGREHGWACVPRSVEALQSGGQCFSVVGVGELRHGDLTLTHELGHNFGCGHGVMRSTHDAGLAASSRGFAWPALDQPGDASGTQLLHGTVMCSGVARRLPRFSSPLVIWRSQVLGGTADNAATVRRTAPVVARYR